LLLLGLALASLRDPLDHVAERGLAVEHLERRFFGVMERLVVSKPLG
jgi:hypothetical protein